MGARQFRVLEAASSSPATSTKKRTDIPCGCLFFFWSRAPGLLALREKSQVSLAKLAKCVACDHFKSHSTECKLHFLHLKRKITSLVGVCSFFGHERRGFSIARLVPSFVTQNLRNASQSGHFKSHSIKRPSKRSFFLYSEAFFAKSSLCKKRLTDFVSLNVFLF